MDAVLYSVAGALAVLSLVFLVVAIRAVRSRRWLGSTESGLTGALFISLAALAATLGVSTQGYRALTLEEVAATITTVPTGPRAFQAFVDFADGRDTTLHVLGDQLMVDAHILKWRPRPTCWASTPGTSWTGCPDATWTSATNGYVLARSTPSRPIRPRDLFLLAQRYTLLALLVDTEYGSATYVEVTRPARFEVRVSTTGLLMREVGYP